MYVQIQYYMYRYNIICTDTILYVQIQYYMYLLQDILETTTPRPVTAKTVDPKVAAALKFLYEGVSDKPSIKDKKPCPEIPPGLGMMINIALALWGR